MSASIVVRIGQTEITQREGGLYCLNDLHKAAGGEERHRPNYWLKLQQTQELIAELENQQSRMLEESAKSLILGNAGIPALDKINDLHEILKVVSAGPEFGGGTFVCKPLVYAYATWVSPAFFLHVLSVYDEAVNRTIAELQHDAVFISGQAAWDRYENESLRKEARLKETADRWGMGWFKRSKTYEAEIAQLKGEIKLLSDLICRIKGK